MKQILAPPMFLLCTSECSSSSAITVSFWTKQCTIACLAVDLTCEIRTEWIQAFRRLSYRKCCLSVRPSVRLCVRLSVSPSTNYGPYDKKMGRYAGMGLNDGFSTFRMFQVSTKSPFFCPVNLPASIKRFQFS